MKNYTRINNLTGLILFGIASLVYWLSMEPTVSFWDCGEFIAASDKLQVGHQPGAPLFLMIGKMFSLLAMGDTAKIAYWINFSSVLFSGATIMFLYWTITALASKLYPAEKTNQQGFSIIAAGIIGALAYTFSDTFWFSAVESEVYALSILCTAIVFWAVLKWEARMDDRWLVLIAFLVGLSIGVHLLSLLAIPAIVLVYYFKKTSQPGTIGTIKAFLVGCLLVGLVQFAVVQYLVLIAAKFDLFFVNNLGYGFGSGAMTFILVLFAAIAYGIYYTIKHQKRQLNLALVCLTFLLFGFSSYFMIVIRAQAKPNINLSNPDNPYSLYSYLGRTNYGDTPLLYGRTFDAKQTEIIETGTDYRKGDKRYEVAGKDYKVNYDKNLFFPRTYSNKPRHPEFYKSWMGLGDNESPGFFQNLSFFSSYQMGFMYWRYFLWNFSGRQSDIQGQGNATDGNWITGIKPIDALRLGNQSKLPPSITANEGNNAFYGLPLIIGLAGLAFLYRKNKQVSLVIATLFFFTGLAIILYLNQDPLQVRERDYAYIGSFYAFAIFIGFGVLAIKEMLARFASAKASLAMATTLCLFAAPILMGLRGWDDHNRSDKTTALDWASNYLNSCAPNAILFTNADNDTYPLWYAQEVEGIRTDVRVVSMQFLGDGDYINQMKKQAGLSAPLPISMTPEKYQKGTRDYLPYVDYGIKDSVELKDLLSVLTSDEQADKVEMQGGSFENFLPTKKLKLSINPAQVIKTHTLAAKDQDKIVPQMEWDFDKNYAGKADLMVFDILANNNWERPIYFASSVSQDTYVGLSDYLYLEGYAHRLLPLKKAENDKRDKSEVTNTDVMYSNSLNKLDFSGFNKAHYLDPETRRVANDTWTFQNTLAKNLVIEGKVPQAKKIMHKAVEQLPLKLYSIHDTLNRLETIQNLYTLNDVKNANLLAGKTVSFVTQELAYIASLTQERQRASLRDIQVGMYVLNGLKELTANGVNPKLNLEIRQKFKVLEDTFVNSLG
jgi:MFS family permease